VERGGRRAFAGRRAWQAEAAAPPLRAEDWPAVAQAAEGDPPDSYWRSLFFFNGYRFIVALLLLAALYAAR